MIRYVDGEMTHIFSTGKVRTDAQGSMRSTDTDFGSSAVFGAHFLCRYYDKHSNNRRNGYVKALGVASFPVQAEQ